MLTAAGRYVSSLEQQLTVLVADERYAQSLFIGREGSARVRRSITSDVAWVPTGDPLVWAFFRDVRDVDGAPVRDREARLERLFPSGPTPAGGERAGGALLGLAPGRGRGEGHPPRAPRRRRGRRNQDRERLQRLQERAHNQRSS